jgi:hypothetical protein
MINDRRFGVLAAGGAAAGMAAIVGPPFGEYLAAVEEHSRWATGLFSGSGIATAIGMLLVFGGVGLTGLLLIVWDDRRLGAVALAHKFEEGAALLKSELEASQVSGAVPLGALALRFPRSYIASVAETLASHVHEATLEHVRQHQGEIANLQTPSASTVAHRQTGAGAHHALSMLGSLRGAGAGGQPWALPARPGRAPGRLTLVGAYLGNTGFVRADFSNIDFRALIGWRVRFVDCDLTNATMEIALDDLLAFENCILNGFALTVTDWLCSPPGRPDSAIRVATEACTVDGRSTLNGGSLGSSGATKSRFRRRRPG